MNFKINDVVMKKKPYISKSLASFLFYLYPWNLVTKNKNIRQKNKEENRFFSTRKKIEKPLAKQVAKQVGKKKKKYKKNRRHPSGVLFFFLRRKVRQRR